MMISFKFATHILLLFNITINLVTIANAACNYAVWNAIYPYIDGTCNYASFYNVPFSIYAQCNNDHFATLHYYSNTQCSGDPSFVLNATHFACGNTDACDTITLSGAFYNDSNCQGDDIY